MAEYSGRSSDSPYPSPFREGMSTVNKPSCDDLEQTDTAGFTKPAAVLGQHCLPVDRQGFEGLSLHDLGWVSSSLSYY